MRTPVGRRADARRQLLRRADRRLIEAARRAPLPAESWSTTPRRFSAAAGPTRGRSTRSASSSGCPTAASSTGLLRASNALPPSDVADCEHLLTRLSGDDADAWEQFKQHEARIGIEPRAMSVVSARLLGAVDLDRARRRRRRQLRGTAPAARPAEHDRAVARRCRPRMGPMCYPFLPAADVDRARARPPRGLRPGVVAGNSDRGSDRVRVGAARGAAAAAAADRSSIRAVRHGNRVSGAVFRCLP